MKLVIIVALLTTVALAGQERRTDPTPVQATAPAPWRTPWGHPDLQGVWTNATDTPLERPAAVAEQQVLSEDELRQRERKAAANLSNEPVVRPGDPGTYNAFWRDPIRPTTRTSLIVDPPDGRIPALTPEALKRREQRAAELKQFPFWRADNPEDRPFFERCIGRGWPRVGGTYQSTYQIFQYQFTIHDPTTFTRPWTVSMPMRPAAGLFEYSCHEGNYGMMNVLRGARKADGEAKKTTGR